MSKIVFTFDDSEGCNVTVETDADHMEAVLEKFKQFLIHVGYHPENVENIDYDAPRRQGLIQQAMCLRDDNFPYPEDPNGEPL